MQPQKKSKPSEPINLSRRHLLKAAAVATPFFIAGRATELLQGAGKSVENVIELGARAAVEHIRQGDMKAEFYVSQLLKQYNEHKDLNAVVTIDEARVLVEARAVDKARAGGQRLGSLAGLPFVVKDQIEVAGYPATAGNAALKRHIPRQSATVVEIMIKNGAVMFAKTNLPDMVAGGNLAEAAASFNRFFGAVHNPYDPKRIPGGSSGGTAAAIAARMVPAGLAEDTGGSVRFPAALCGLAGLRPSTFTLMNAMSGESGRKRYPDAGIVPPPGFLETIGPMARSVFDVAFLDSVITGQVVPTIQLREARIGIPRPSYWDNENIDQGLAKVIQTAFARLRDAGAPLVEIDFDAVLQINAGNRLNAAIPRPGNSFEEWLAKNLPGVTLEEVYAGRPRPTQNPAQQSQLSTEERAKILTEAGRLYTDVFQSNGLIAIAFPTIPIPAPLMNPNGETVGQKTLVNGKMVDSIAAMIPNIFFGPRLGVPGLVLPAGLTAGLPVGLEFEGLPGADSRLLGLGIAVEKVLGPIPPPALVRRGS